MPKKGYKQSSEHRIKNLKTLLKYSFKNGFNPKRFSKGQKHSEEAKRKMRGLNWRPRKYKKTDRKVGKLKVRKIGIHERIRKTEKYIWWRSEVFKRDDWTCQWCQKRGIKIEADHIISMAQIIEEARIELGENDLLQNLMTYSPLWEIKNGRTLCKPCHKLTPTWGVKLKRRSRSV